MSNKVENGILAALNMLSAIPVKGTAVKPMAMAMQHLENALEDIHREETGKEGENGR